MLLSREERERRQRQRAKKSRSQLLGPVAQGGRRPMQQGYTYNRDVQDPNTLFRKSTVADDITQASLAYKGGKGLFDWTQGKEAYTDKLGEFHKAREPFAMPDFGGRLNQMGEGISNFGQNLWNTEPGVAVGKSGELTSSMFGAPWEPLNMGGGGGLGSAPSPFISTTGGSSSGLLAPEVAQATQAGSPEYFQALNPSATNQLSTSTVPQGIDKLGLAGAGFGTGMSIYDMVDRGVTPGNAMGLIGSLGVGGASLFPKLAALGPLGIGIGAIGGLGSLFDLW